MEEQVKAFAKKFGISEDQAKASLKYHAARWSGCVRCKHSLPSKSDSWLMRSCPFGMRQENCTLFEEIEEDE